MRKFKYTYKNSNQVTKKDEEDFLYKIKGVVPDGGLPLVHSKEVALEPLRRREKRETVFSRLESRHNTPSSRINRKTGRTLDRSIQLYRLWFRYLKLALELEELKVDLVVKRHNRRITYTDKLDVPKKVIDQAIKLEGGSKSGGLGGSDAIFRCRVIQRVKVKRSAYKGWDLDQVLNDTFDKWWKTHSYLFEGHLPTFLDSKNDWIDDDNFLYIRIDKTTQWADVDTFMREKVGKRIRDKGTTRYRVTGKQPRVNVFQNNLNALILSLKKWKGKEICEHKKIYLRRTDENELSSRGSGDRLTVPKDKNGKKLYSSLVSRQKRMGIWHLLEVCDGRFGASPPHNW